MKAQTTTFALAMLASAVAQAAPGFCDFAGNYQGKYSGRVDHGSITAMVGPDTGIVLGTAMSASGQAVPFRGVISATGEFSPAAAGGNADTGATFAGQFRESDGEASGSGRWALAATGDGGQWQVARTSSPGACQ